MKSFWEGQKEEKIGPVLSGGGLLSQVEQLLRSPRDRHRCAGPTSLALADSALSLQLLYLLTRHRLHSWAIPSCGRGYIHFR